jgi:DNA-binding NarL/FixJ family response regulator
MERSISLNSPLATDKKKIKVIFADDQVLFLEGMRVLLGDQECISIIGEAETGQGVLDLVVKEKPDVIVTDIQMPEMDGIEMTRELQSYFPEIKIIALTMYEDEHLIVDMLEAGAKGYLLKSSKKEKLLEAIHVVHGNGIYFCETTSLKLLRKIAGSKLKVNVSEDANKLTETEKQIVRLICEQYSSKEIADKLHLGLKTVEGYRNKMFDKIGVKNMAGLVIYAIRSGIFQP